MCWVASHAIRSACIFSIKHTNFRRKKTNLFSKPLCPMVTGILSCLRRPVHKRMRVRSLLFAAIKYSDVLIVNFKIVFEPFQNGALIVKTDKTFYLPSSRFVHKYSFLYFCRICELWILVQMQHKYLHTLFAYAIWIALHCYFPTQLVPHLHFPWHHAQASFQQHWKQAIPQTQRSLVRLTQEHNSTSSREVLH